MRWGSDRDTWPGEEAATRAIDRRVWERVAIEVEVTLTSDSQFFAGLSGDLSEGGLFVQTYERYEVGRRLFVTFSLPTGDVRASGVVRWIRDPTSGGTPGVGIAFDPLLNSERASIEAFCRVRPPLYHDSDSD